MSRRRAAQQPADTDISRELSPVVANLYDQAAGIVRRKPTYNLRPKSQVRATVPRRSGFLVGVFAVLFGIVVVRTAAMQTLDYTRYTKLAADRRLRTAVLAPVRGRILDRNGVALATTAKSPSVWVDPSAVDDPDKTVARLRAVLAQDPSAGRIADDATLVRRLSDRNKRFAWIARHIQPDVASAVEGLRLPGVHLIAEADRRYPSGPLAGALLGFTNLDGQGQAGLERAWEDSLAGKPGEIIAERDPRGRTIPVGAYQATPATVGKDLQTTIDTAIQAEAEAGLDDAIRANGAKGGAVTLMDATTGEVLAFASRPTYDPNDPAAGGPEKIKGWGIGDVFEPGSTSKVVTMSAALEEGVVHLDDHFSVPGAIKIWDQTFHDDEPHNAVDLDPTGIMAHSSNVGTIMIADKLGAKRLAEWTSRFGYGRKTAVGLPGESAGIMRPAQKWAGTDVAAISIGHTVAATPLQMLRVFGTIANGGVMVDPHLVTATAGPGGTEPVPAPPAQRILSTQTANTVSQMLTHVVTEGTGTKAAIPGFSVAGKTGTARKVVKGEGYVKDKTVASFVGFAPVENPRIVAMVVLDEPATIYGADAAAPTFSRVVGFALREMRVVPSPQPQEIRKPLGWPGGPPLSVTLKPPAPANDPSPAAKAPYAPEPPVASDHQQSGHASTQAPSTTGPPGNPAGNPADNLADAKDGT